MQRRGLFLAAVGVATIAIIAACVGDNPTTPGGGTPDGGSPETSSTPDTGTPTPENDSGGEADTGVDAAKRYCETLLKPAAPIEFFCADFDGPDASEGFTNTIRVDGGLLDLTNTVAVSLPQALATRAADGGNGTGPAVQWTSVGAKNFAEAVLRARVNPSNSGGVATYVGKIKLLEIRTSNGSAALHYTKGGTLSDPPNSTPNYTGYYIRVAVFGGAAQSSEHALATPLPETTWTDVKLSFFKNGRVTLTYDGNTVFDQTKYSSTDSSVTFTVGAAASGSTNEQRTFRYDNVEHTLTRDP